MVMLCAARQTNDSLNDAHVINMTHFLPEKSGCSKKDR